jgi:trehalose/maltose transport system permease protein
MGPSLSVAGLPAFISAWNEFMFALTFTLSTEQRTVPVAIASSRAPRPTSCPGAG